MSANTIHFFGAIEKFDAAADGSLMVSGIASTEAVDAQGEIVTADSMRKALPEYLRAGTIREMHQPIAAGRPIAAFVDDDGRTHLTAHIVDKGTIEKIKAGVLKGFSIGGKALKKVGNSITELLLKDVSVVDISCNPECVFTVIKFDAPASNPAPKLEDESMNAELVSKVDKLTETVTALTNTVTTLAGTVKTISESSAPADKLEKALADLGELQKRSNETQQAMLVGERNSIIAKMDSEGRVAFNETGVAYKRDELEKMELPMLKFAARNAAIVPLVAKSIYRGDAKPKIPAEVKGSDRIQKYWEQELGSTLEEMKQRFPVSGN